MALNDDILQRWLDQAANHEPLRLGGGGKHEGGVEPGMTGSDAEEVRRQWNRLQLMQGLLGTLDGRHAPAELDDRVAADVAREAARALEGLAEPKTEVVGADQEIEAIFEDAYLDGDAGVDMGDWIAGSLAESQQGPGKAPEFLDRIVEQRLSAIEGQLKDARRRDRRVRLVRRGSLALTCVLVLSFLPWSTLLNPNGNAGPAEIQMIQHTSLASMQLAHPEQVQLASRMGEFGIFSGFSGTDKRATDNGVTSNGAANQAGQDSEGGLK